MYHRQVKERNPISRIVSYGFVMIFIFGVLGVFLVRSAVSSYKEKDAGINAAIGREIILNGDSLMVVDYNWWENHYILQDGTQISTKLLDNLYYLPQIEANGDEEETEKAEGD